MEKKLLKTIDDILKNIGTENNIKEEVFIHLIREVVLKKYGISHDSYIKFISKPCCKVKSVQKEEGLILPEFLSENLGSLDLINIEDIGLEEITKNLSNNLDLLNLCSILEEYMNNQKRELTGSYYTPTFIIEFMVSNSIKSYLEENTQIDTISLEKLIDDEIICNIRDSQLLHLLEILTNLKVIDISCGSGLFLHYTFEKIFSMKALIYNALNYELDEYSEKKWILENNIFGVDIQQVPLEMVTLKYIDILAGFEEFNLVSLNFNLYKRNSVLGNEIFTVSQINEVINEGGFDIVIGNPPYIGEKGNKNIFENIRKHGFGKKYYEAKMDYFYYFIYRGIDILKDKGVLAYITTNYFITADGARNLRKFLKDKVSFKNIINFNEYEIFKAAKGQHNITFTVVKGAIDTKNINIKYIKNNKLKRGEITEIIKNKKGNNLNISSYILNKQSSLYGINGNIMIFSEEKYSGIVKKIKSCSNLTLGDVCNINQGIVSGADKVTKRMLHHKLNKENMEKNNIVIDKGIFVLNKEEILNSNMGNCKLLKPFYKNSDIRKYFANNSTDKYVLYFTDKNICNSDYCFVIQNHLRKYKDVLSLRRETKQGTRNWFALQWSREQNIFEAPKIVVPHRALQNNFGYNEGMWYASADVYFITAKKENIDLKLLLGILNSKIMYFWLYNMGKRKGDYLELYSNPLAQIPVNLSFDINIKEYIVKITNEILSCCKDDYDYKLIEKYQDKIDKKLYKVFGLNDEEIKTINELYITKQQKNIK